jgi:hypothetical protein
MPCCKMGQIACELSPRSGETVLGILKALQRIDLPPVKFRLPVQILLLLCEGRCVILNLASRNVDLRLEVARFDLE